MEEDRLDWIFKRETSATAEEVEAIAGCLSRDTVTAILLGVVTEILSGSVSGETSACVVGRLEKTDKNALLVVLIDFHWDDQVVLGYDREATADLRASTWQSIWQSVFLCLNKEEWLTFTSDSRLNIDDVGIDALRCFLNELGLPGLVEFMAAAEREGAPLSLEMFSAAESCGIDLESLLPKQTREPTREPTPTATPQEQPAPTAVPAQPMAAPAPTAVPAATPAPAATQAPFEKAPDFELPFYRNRAGEPELRLSDLRGTPVVLNFWFADCLPCRPTMSAIETVYKSGRWAEVQFLGIQIPRGTEQLDPDRGQAFAEEIGVSYALVFDAEGEVSRNYGIAHSPTTIVLDLYHNIVGRWVGGLDENTLEKLIGQVASLSVAPRPLPTPLPAQPTAVPVATPVPAPTAAPAETPVTEPTVAPLATAVPAPTASPPTAPVRYGGEVSLAVERDPFDGNFSPFDGQSTEKAQVNSLIFSRLMRRSASGIVPDLAAWWDVSHDGREWTVGLKNASFHDGRPVTAADVLYSIEAMDERFNTLPEYAALAVVDEYTLHIEFKEPVRDFPSRMTRSGSVIVPRGMLEAGVRDFTQLVGSGPFRPVHYERDVSLALVRNPDYYETGLPYLDHILIHVITDRGTRSAAFRAGQLDYLGFPYSGLPALTLDDARSVPEVTFAPYPEVYALWFDTQSPPFDDQRVRVAVNFAIDPQAIGAFAGEVQSTIPHALFPEWATYLDEQSDGHRAVAMTEQWHVSNPEVARVLLAQAGHPDGFDTVMQIAEDVPPYWDSVAEAVSAMMQDVGITLVWERVPSGEELLYTPADRNIKFMRVQAFDGDVRAFLREHFAAGGSYNYSRTDIAVPPVDPHLLDSIIPVQQQLAKEVFYIPLPAPLYARGEWVHGPLTGLDIHDIGWTLKEVWVER